MPSEYEKIRLKNLEDNKKILSQLGLLNPFEPLPRINIKASAPKRKRPAGDTPSRPAKKFIVSTPTTTEIEGYGSIQGEKRRSSRILGQAAATPKEINEEVSKWIDDDDETPKIRVTPNRPNVYGAIPDVAVGTVWLTRMEACAAGIQRPTVAGIHGGPEGAYSIALSGGYEDDIDLGECFTYTGEGGRDLKGTKNNPKNLRTAPQSKDQVLERGNLALSLSVESGHPVRVIRGYKLRSAYAPEEGYRYDGLYRVEKFWFTTGLSGYGVYKFVLKRLEDQAPPPWTYDGVTVSNKRNSDTEEDAHSQDSGMGSEPPSVAVSEAPSEAGSESGGSPKKVIEENNNEVKSEIMKEEKKDEDVNKVNDTSNAHIASQFTDDKNLLEPLQKAENQIKVEDANEMKGEEKVLKKGGTVESTDSSVKQDDAIAKENEDGLDETDKENLESEDQVPGEDKENVDCK